MGKTKLLTIYCAVIVFLCLGGASNPASANQGLTTGEYSQIFCKVMDLVCQGNESASFTDISKSRFQKEISTMGNSFPGAQWTGKQWHANPETVLNTEMLIKSFVIWTGIKLKDYSSSNQTLKDNNLNVEKMGYSSDSIPYIAGLINNGLSSKDVQPNVQLTYSTAMRYLSKLKAIVAIPEIPKDASDQLTISNTKFLDKQEYYPDGPIENYLNVIGHVDENDKLHQFSAIKGSTDSSSDKLGYAIGIWGQATTSISGNKLVGGFFTVEGFGEGAKSQLVGQEIDVINKLPKNFEGEVSSVGQQIVTTGTHDSTAAIEIIADGVSKWENGISLTENSITEEGTVIGLSQQSSVKYGLDFGNTPFSGAAIRVSPSSPIKFESSDYMHPATINLSTANIMQFVVGTNGLVIKSNDMQKNLLEISPSGEIVIGTTSISYIDKTGNKAKVNLSQIGDPKSEANIDMSGILFCALVAVIIYVMRNKNELI